MIGFRLPQMPDVNVKYVKMTLREVKNSSDEQLLSILAGESDLEGIVPMPLQNIITTELLRRNLERSTRPHWSVTPSFCLIIVGTLAACIAAYPVLFSQPQAASSVETLTPNGQRVEPAHNEPANSQPKSERSKSSPGVMQKK